MFDDTLIIFRENPKMKYFYDELFNNNGYVMVGSASADLAKAFGR